MSDEVLKPDKDFSTVLDAELPEVETLVSQSRPQEALDRLLTLEKKTRQAADLASSKRVLVRIVDLLYAAHDWKQLNEQVQLLSKKHGQLKQAIAALVQQAIKALDEASAAKTISVDTQIETIDNIRSVTEGKIFVEVERARVSRTLAKIKLAAGDIDGACDVLGELQVETYGSMDMREKTEFILEQIELYISKGDFVQASITSRKIVARYFVPEKVHDLKLRYYKLMIEIALHDNKYLEVCQHYRELYDTPRVVNDEALWKPIVQDIVLYIVLAPYDNLQSDLIHRIEADPKLQTLPLYLQLIKSFTANELMRWPKVEEYYGKALRETDVFSAATEQGNHRYGDLRKRVIEHNLRVVSKYYTRIHTGRLTALLDLTESETEQFLSNLVTQGTIYARINRPQRVVDFTAPKNGNEMLNEWASNVSELLGHIETVEHLITKDEMMSQLRP